MTELPEQHVDQKAEAEKAFRYAHTIDTEFEGTPRAQMIMTQGLIHATLAVAEATERLAAAQETANLIALAAHAVDRFGAFAGEAGGMGTLFSYGDDPSDNMRIRDEIRKTLGLS